jgi:hypothetical protein
MRLNEHRVALAGVVLSAACVLGAPGAGAVQPKPANVPLDNIEFFLPELYVSTENVPLAEAPADLPNREAWERFRVERAAAGQDDVVAFIDTRSGVATNIVSAFPLIPGDGVGNDVTLGDLSARLGRAVSAVDARTVAEAAFQFVGAHKDVLGVDLAQLGPVRAVQVSEHLWHVSIPQQVNGVQVRDARLVLTVSHGNVVIFGTQVWGPASVRTRPAIDAEQALEAGFAYAGGRSLADRVTREPQLEIVPVSPQELLSGEAYGGPLGKGYRHRLVWTFTFQRAPEHADWEAMIDALSGEVIAFQDTNHYVNKQVTGGVYPLTSTEICPNAAQCGTMQTNWPMPWANTGLAAPNDFTNSGGIFNYTSGTVTTSLNGRYVRMTDTCGALSASSTTGDIPLGGANGQHDCTTPGTGGAGNTPASRSGFYELNKLAEQARGWLPSNTWLQSQLTSNMNINSTCNAFWNGSTVNFYRSGGGCRNTGEIAAVFDHEWGHGLDDFDSGGVLSNSSEGYADIAAIYRLQASCVGHGFFWTSNRGCGMTADGTGYNQNESQTGTHCNTDCSGVRDSDWAKHADNTPDTALGFVCTHCSSSSGPCGRQVHCAAAPARQAAWDLVTRDLTSAPFSLDSQTAFLIGNKVFYQGSGNIGLWHNCACGSSSDGCGATNGYMQWLAADDDNGNVNDGTPHMTALYNAFNRHGIACSTPTAVNSGCAGGPTTAPTLSGTAGAYQAALSWNTVSGASKYWVLRTEGHAGCDFGKAKIAEVTTTSYTDTQVAAGRNYYYNVVAQGTSAACFTRVSNCATVTPTGGTPTPDFSVSVSPSSLSIAQGASGSATVTVTSINGFSAAVTLSASGLPSGVTASFSVNPVTPPANGTASSTLTLTASSSAATGTFPITITGTSGATSRATTLTLTVTPTGGGGNAVYDAVLRAPKCATVGNSCDTGASLVLGRDTISGGAEPNQPNTINSSCADGTAGVFHSDESNDRLKVYTLDGTNFAPGKTVRIEATVWAWASSPTSDKLDLYYAANANAPVWTYLTTLTPSVGGAQVLSATYTLPAGTLQAVRANFRYVGSASSCSTGSFDDRDDLIFAVQ